ncbi:hypothetical protein CSKR_204113 [Clonorchis sinensis]|uniref:Uncharacterized protein n=1 Tax=Clonorchis sinensis TaxID=79923 RepID=A0A8T1N1P5_CLOSI|nr:hypothetical protein CSKR_204113 [Clonorchis sinensis]
MVDDKLTFSESVLNFGGPAVATSLFLQPTSLRLIHTWSPEHGTRLFRKRSYHVAKPCPARDLDRKQVSSRLVRVGTILCIIHISNLSTYRSTKRNHHTYTHTQGAGIQQVHGQLRNTRSNYTAENTGPHPNFHPGTLTSYPKNIGSF